MCTLGEVKITLVSNAGILVEYRGQKLLIDGVYYIEDRGGAPFSNIPRDIWSAMLAGEPPFDDIDWLLFTHAHSDHFSPSRVKNYLRYRRVKGLILPPDTGEQAELRTYLKQMHIPYVSAENVCDFGVFEVGNNVTVTVYATRHIGKEFLGMPHYTYLLSLGDKKLLITSDVDYTYETFPELEGMPLHAVFVNPLFFNALQRERFFRGRLWADSVCVYHVPLSEKDVVYYGGTLQRTASRWTAERSEQLYLLENPGQQIRL